jgi:hypothetical protein
MNNIVTTTTNSACILYAKLLLSLEGHALQSIVIRKHLKVNGLCLLQELMQT